MTAQSFQLLEERLRTLRNGGVEIHHPVFEKTCPVNRKNGNRSVVVDPFNRLALSNAIA